jgi:hypothetical protein
MIAGAITGVAASALGYGNVFWVCAALSAVAALGMLTRHALGRRALAYGHHVAPALSRVPTATTGDPPAGEPSQASSSSRLNS